MLFDFIIQTKSCSTVILFITNHSFLMHYKLIPLIPKLAYRLNSIAIPPIFLPYNPHLKISLNVIFSLSSSPPNRFFFSGSLLIRFLHIFLMSTLASLISLSEHYELTCKSRSFLLCNFLNYLLTSYFSLHIFLSILFPEACNLCSSLGV